MTDRELLTLAAKAAGINTIIWTESPRSKGQTAGCIWNGVGPGDTAELWNPLTDDGDALRLAVKIGRSRTLQLVVGVGGADCQFDHPLVTAFESGDDPYAATRRAIVRAAAEIGRKM